MEYDEAVPTATSQNIESDAMGGGERDILTKGFKQRLNYAFFYYKLMRVPLFIHCIVVYMYVIEIDHTIGCLYYALLMHIILYILYFKLKIINSSFTFFRDLKTIFQP